MTDTLRVILEIGKKERRVVAGAMDWPGLDRWGKTDDDAIAKLTAYLPHVVVAERAALSDEFARHLDVEVVERVAGSARPTSGVSPTSRQRSSLRSSRLPTSSGD